MQSSTLSFGPCLLNKPCIKSSLFTDKNRILHDFVPPKKLVFPGLKKQKPLIVKSSVKSTSAVLTNHIIPLVFHSVAWVVRTLTFKPKANCLSSGFFEEGDLIRLNLHGNALRLDHTGNCIVGVVQHIGFSETTLIGPTVGDEKLFGFYTLFHRKTDQPYKFIKEIESVLEKNEIIRDNDIYNGAYKRLNDKFEVACYVNCSKLQSPLFKSYLEVSGQVLADIDRSIYRKNAIADYFKFW
ncbi:hypothetical protein MKW94_002451 [Papaver nudicaule]|uniref:Uncharacterized protein n=1 Tax=Papaver nudicaule TaxID=74823 RepID=A0AA41S6U5_PAPNU|nr:hypothetical protein [Papaver nudicaule]